MRENDWGWLADPEDWSQVNTKNGGSTHYGVKLWCGYGYMLDLYSVWADSPEDALDIVAEWCRDNQPSDIVQKNRVDEEMIKNIVSYVREYHIIQIDDTMSDEEIMDILSRREDFGDIYDTVWYSNYMNEWVTPVGDGDIYVRTENLFIDKWPDNY